MDIKQPRQIIIEHAVDCIQELYPDDPEEQCSCGADDRRVALDQLLQESIRERKKRVSILKLDFWYSDKKSTQPELDIQWSIPSKGAVDLMFSSVYVFAKGILEDNSIDSRIKEELYGFCKAYCARYSPQEDKQ